MALLNARMARFPRATAARRRGRRRPVEWIFPRESWRHAAEMRWGAPEVGARLTRRARYALRQASRARRREYFSSRHELGLRERIETGEPARSRHGWRHPPDLAARGPLGKAESTPFSPEIAWHARCFSLAA